jgi:hypothetical protein
VQRGLSGTGASVTVPVGHVYIVKQLTMYMNSTLGDIDAVFQDAVSGAALFHGAVSTGGGAWFGFYGALVFEAGDEMRFVVASTFSESADVSASGYDLTA